MTFTISKEAKKCKIIALFYIFYINKYNIHSRVKRERKSQRIKLYISLNKLMFNRYLILLFQYFNKNLFFIVNFSSELV